MSKRNKITVEWLTALGFAPLPDCTYPTYRHSAGERGPWVEVVMGGLDDGDDVLGTMTIPQIRSCTIEDASPFDVLYAADFVGIELNSNDEAHELLADRDEWEAKLKADAEADAVADAALAKG